MRLRDRQRDENERTATAHDAREIVARNSADRRLPTGERGSGTYHSRDPGQEMRRSLISNFMKNFHHLLGSGLSHLIAILVARPHLRFTRTRMRKREREEQSSGCTSKEHRWLPCSFGNVFWVVYFPSVLPFAPFEWEGIVPWLEIWRSVLDQD